MSSVQSGICRQMQLVYHNCIDIALPALEKNEFKDWFKTRIVGDAVFMGYVSIYMYIKW